MAEQLKGKRTALKGWVTRLTAQLTELCSDDKPDIEILADSITQLQSKLNNLDTVQSEIESKLPASELDADLEEAFNFKQKARLIKIKASSFLADGKVLNEGKSDGSVSGAKLPKIELPRFSGNILEWCSFQEQFDSQANCTSRSSNVLFYFDILQTLDSLEKNNYCLETMLQ